MKRFICVMLTLIMLVSLVPAAAVTASAASRSTSAAAISVLKNMVKFRDKCYKVGDTDEYRIGYGTVCTESNHKDAKTHKINQTIGDQRLREALKKLDTTVNNFASNNSLTLKQNQFDALVVFSYLSGTAWMSGTGTVKTVVVNKGSTAELLTAMNGVYGEGAMNRNKVIVNMYMNNVYSNDVPDNYTSVTYHTNGGYMAQGDEYKMDYDSSKSVEHPVKPTRSGYKFLGWYISSDGTEEKATSRSAELNSGCSNKNLVALWQSTSTTASTADSNPDVSYKLGKTADIFKTPSTSAEKAGTADASAIICKDYLASDGTRWGKIEGKGWVKVSGGSSSSGDSGTPGSERIGVNVTNSFLNVRKEANIYSAKTATLKQNDRVYISRTENANGFLWGKTYKSRSADTPIGWIALMYTDYNTAKNEQSSSGSTSANTVIANATITYNGYVNLRNAAGTDNKIVGSLGHNETVNVYEIKTVNGHQWGRTSAGWFCMTYASVKMLSGSSDVSNSGSLSYTYSGKYVGPGFVYSDTSEVSSKTSVQPDAGKTVSIITMKVTPDGTWAKIGWTYKNSKGKDATQYGWVKVTNETKTKSEVLDEKSAPVSLNPAKFKVVADNVTVRDDANSGAESVLKLNKGYTFTVSGIQMVGENIWGYTTELTNENAAQENGWINLASKYAQRADKVTSTTTSSDKGIATIVGADRVNVRADSKISGKFVGQLTRGTTAKVLKERDGWYKLDVDVDNNPDTSSWVYGDYVEISSSSSTTNAPSSHGNGVVANTYGGLNVRTGPGTAYAIVGNKLLPGTPVKILETKYVGTTRWGRCDKGWVCMDYISMINEEVDTPEPDAPNGGSWVKDYDEVDRTTTTAVYTGEIKPDLEYVNVFATTEKHLEEEGHDFAVKQLHSGDPVTIYELIAVVEKVEVEDDTDSGTTTEETVTSYWARINDGYIRDPQKHIQLDALDEKTHTLTGSETLNVRPNKDGSGDSKGQLKKGDKVQVTALNIVKDKVWGQIEFEGETGWIRLDYMSEGALYEQTEQTKPTTPNNNSSSTNNNNNSTGDTGKSDGNYRYDGKVINTDELKVRAKATTNSTEVRKLKKGETIYIYETTISDGMAWGRCDAGWVYLYYIDLVPRIAGVEDARVVYNPGTPIYSDMNKTEKVGSYTSMATIDLLEIVGNMGRTELGWVSLSDLL
ncbi:MAG: SH3 domain-containing protein [Eubacteriales bacterium]|nr:SH3 domain-containing protein [Eubacteriales bacterium]